MRDYYQILHLPANATREDIKQAFRVLAKQYHPDVNKSPDAHVKFCEIAEAYEFLMNHWPEYKGQYSSDHSSEQVFTEHEKTDWYERFRKEAQERAKRQAQMRYEKFRKQHEAFDESGLNDIALVFTMLTRAFSAVLFLFLVFTPIFLAVFVQWSWIFVLFFMWPFALGIGWYYYDNRKNYFVPGHFYYSFSRIKRLFTDVRPASQWCYYAAGKFADSKPYQLDLLRLKDIKLRSEGARQHNVNYINQNYSVMIPRSRKALIVHTTSVVIKLTSLISCILFLDVSSVIWRIIAGILAGGIITRLLLVIVRTKSNITYLYSSGFLIRVAMWITAICLASRFYTGPFNIYSTDAIHFVVVAIVVFDSFVMQLISLLFGNRASYPVFRQYDETSQKFKEGFIVYNDVPIISFVYPLFRWIFG